MAASTLIGLPPELKYMIVSYLHRKRDLKRLSRVNHELREYSSPGIWRSVAISIDEGAIDVANQVFACIRHPFAAHVRDLQIKFRDASSETAPSSNADTLLLTFIRCIPKDQLRSISFHKSSSPVKVEVVAEFIKRQQLLQHFSAPYMKQEKHRRSFGSLKPPVFHALPNLSSLDLLVGPAREAFPNNLLAYLQKQGNTPNLKRLSIEGSATIVDDGFKTHYEERSKMRDTFERMNHLSHVILKDMNLGFDLLPLIISSHRPFLKTLRLLHCINAYHFLSISSKIEIPLHLEEFVFSQKSPAAFRGNSVGQAYNMITMPSYLEKFVSILSGLKHLHIGLHRTETLPSVHSFSNNPATLRSLILVSDTDSSGQYYCKPHVDRLKSSLGSLNNLTSIAVDFPCVSSAKSWYPWRISQFDSEEELFTFVDALGACLHLQNVRMTNLPPVSRSWKPFESEHNEPKFRLYYAQFLQALATTVLRRFEKALHQIEFFSIYSSHDRPALYDRLCEYGYWSRCERVPVEFHVKALIGFRGKHFIRSEQRNSRREMEIVAQFFESEDKFMTKQNLLGERYWSEETEM